MKFSIVIPVYNTGRLIRRMIDSVLSQTEGDFELICVDDGSTDGTDRVLEEYAARDARISVLRQKNQGPYASRTAGVAVARGDFVYVCDHDDRLHPQLLEFCHWVMKEHHLDFLAFGHEDREEQCDYAVRPLPSFSTVRVRSFSQADRVAHVADYCSALADVHIDQWAHVMTRTLAQRFPFTLADNLARPFAQMKAALRWGIADAKLYLYNVGNQNSLIRKAPSAFDVSEIHRGLVKLLNLYAEERESGNGRSVWETVCRAFLVPNVKMLHNMIRRGKKSLVSQNLLADVRFRFALLVDDLFYERGVPWRYVKWRKRFAYRWSHFLMRPDLSESREALKIRVLRNKDRFEALLRAKPIADEEDALLDWVNRVVGFAASYSTTFYSCDVAEKALCRIAMQHEIPLSKNFEPRSTLHVMTSYLAVGGHTRVVERWIGCCSKSEKQSVAVLMPPNAEPPPQALADAVAHHHGDIILFEADSVMARALKLRVLASHFERVVLHVFAGDVVPILAFGTCSFKRPVFLFNHADHVFGLGVSIADGFVDFRAWGRSFSQRFRGTRNSRLLHLPTSVRTNFTQGLGAAEKLKLRQKLGLPASRKIVVSAASAYKFRPFAGMNFLSVVDEVVRRMPEVLFVMVGPSRIDGTYRNRKFVMTVGMVEPDRLQQYFMCADLVVDSLPFGSGLSLLDAALCGAPTLSCDTAAGKLDYVYKSPAYVKTFDDLPLRICHTLKDSAERTANHEKIVRLVEEEQNCARWASSCAEMLTSACKHRISDFSTVSAEAVSDLDMLREVHYAHIKLKFTVPRVLEVLSLNKDGRRRHTVRMFPPPREAMLQ